MVETVLVTGGTGFVGGWCIRELLERGYAVRTTLRSLSKEPALRAAVGAEGPAGERLAVFIADLTSDEGWGAAMAGCDYVLHVASPLGGGVDDEALIGPARDGTLRVLRAAVAAGVKRVVMTSAAATARPPRDSGKDSDESVWADPADPQFDGYRRSKILAERAAWDFMASAGGVTTLTTVLPSAVFGPVLSKENLGSVRIIQGIMQGRPARLPRLGFWVVDVRDLADIHIRAMTSPDAAGQRFIAAGDYMWMEDMAKALRSALGPAAAKVPTRRMPDFAFRLASRFTPQLRFFTPELGRKMGLSSEKARRVLGFSPRPATTTVVECAQSLPGAE
ncbi:MAG: NAD-dependent epimerase/dehydratase family protein [Pseudomonadota bacterium]|uniref:NAD-dependent epimerase/dehydratase family protein n=1 Tax=Phenylobacterium sp. TaxID=1871053 RepID=UPI0025EDB625|nr:NAD-dependent epimerase/dehydratase family protein [Phenylobacterium sp.]MBT9471538.1 NAD-dependent epimerase/dehydratase family protein [Phenylobacterium sp.]